MHAFVCLFALLLPLYLSCTAAGGRQVAAAHLEAGPTSSACYVTVTVTTEAGGMSSDGARWTSTVQHVCPLPDGPAVRVRLLFQPPCVGAVPHRLPDGTGQEPDGDPGELACWAKG